MKWTFCFLLALFLKTSISLWAIPQYYCTGANTTYYKCLLNLIGSIHKHNYDNLVEIAVFDLGLEPEQKAKLQKISKVKLYSLQENNPNLLSFFLVEQGPLKGKRVLGWYAWKPVAIKEALRSFPYLLWLDSACVVLKPLDHLFAHIQSQGYFFTAAGAPYPLAWCTTDFVRKLFSLNNEENKWVLDQEQLMAGFVGVSKEYQELFLNEWYMYTKDIRNFADDGTSGGGWGTCRHDQTLLSIMAHLKGCTIHPLQIPPACIKGENSVQTPFYVSWKRDHLAQTNVLVQNGDFRSSEHLKCIKYKKHEEHKKDRKGKKN